MIQVWLVDGKTRLYFVITTWSQQILERLRRKGHTVVLTDQNGDIDDRSPEELAARDELLEGV